MDFCCNISRSFNWAFFKISCKDTSNNSAGIPCRIFFSVVLTRTPPRMYPQTSGAISPISPPRNSPRIHLGVSQGIFLGSLAGIPLRVLQKFCLGFQKLFLSFLHKLVSVILPGISTGVLPRNFTVFSRRFL